jgi:hypothetical protein
MEEVDKMRKRLLELGFAEDHNRYFNMIAPGHIAHWTSIHVDTRWFNKDKMIIIKGFRGDEYEPLFRGWLDTVEDLEQVLTWVNAI